MSGTVNNPEKPLNRLSNYAIKTVCLAALATGIAWNVRFAGADLLAQRHQPEALRTAMRVMPANGAYAAQLADQVYATDPKLATSLLQTAVGLNPDDAASWIQLGLLYEAANNMAAAESGLLRAADADATFLPSWSLANFYFRRQNIPQFWRWAQRAAQMAPGDATSLFRLAWYVTPSVPLIENRLQLQRPAIESQFVNFVITQGDPQGVEQAAAHLLQAGNRDSAASVLAACDWLLATKHPGLALSLWNSLAAQRQIAYPPVAPAMADTVINGNFAQPPLSLGFDWHMASVEGVSSFLNTSPNALGFEFSGGEPDRFVLLNQTVAVEAEKPYALLIDYDIHGIAPDRGLAWTVTDNQTGSVLGTTGVSAPQQGKAIACFATPRDVHFVDLSLAYQRLPGTVRPEGKLAVTEVRLSAATAPQCAPKNSPFVTASPAF